jgi:hypothetical protein
MALGGAIDSKNLSASYAAAMVWGELTNILSVDGCAFEQFVIEKRLQRPHHNKISGTVRFLVEGFLEFGISNSHDCGIRLGPHIRTP